MNKPSYITILGGGPAGLAVGYFAKKKGLPFALYEARARTGGNAITVTWEGFRFDTGAHRFHNKDPEVSGEIKALLGEGFRMIHAPSQIYQGGQYIDFPLSPLDLLLKLGLSTFTKAGLELLVNRVRRDGNAESFERSAVQTYGRTIAERFLLNYTEKLWGRPCDQLSIDISGKRLKGLDLETFLKEAFLGKRAKTAHLDGSFYYPEMGYGTLVENLAAFCGQEQLHTNSRVTKIYHHRRRVTAIEINAGEPIPVEEVVSTLPLPLLIQLLDPRPPQDLLALAGEMKFRNLIILAFFLARESVTPNASIYFPDRAFPFTRVYEPNNRSKAMSPPGKTSLCVEIPCDPKDARWNASHEDLINLVQPHLIRLGWIKTEELLGTKIVKMDHAYPILALGLEEKVGKLIDYLDQFHNLHLSGRNGKFLYAHVHDMLRFGMDIVQGQLGPRG
jgi:protoporphyrinogen oxidase